MSKPKGITVTLYERTQTGVDAFNAPVYTETQSEISNVLISPSENIGEDITDTLNLNGRTAHYTLAIPKGDTHIWENGKVEFFGRLWNVVGIPAEGIEEMIPLSWNKKVKVEVIE